MTTGGPRSRAAVDSTTQKTRTSTHPALCVVGSTVFVIAVGLGLFLFSRDQEAGRLASFPAAKAFSNDTQVSLDEFTGPSACAACHSSQYEAWSTSTHGRAGGEPGPATVIAPFDGRPIQFADAIVIPSARSGVYQFAVQQDGREEVVYRVDGVIGRGHMIGGGTQGFVSEFEDGTIRFLPFDFIRDEGVWFCNTITRANRGWLPITTDMALADCGDWPPQRVLGTEARFSNCQECHGSQILIKYDPQSRRYETNVNAYSVNCESCHGPGAEHVRLASAGNLSNTLDLAIKTFVAIPTDSSLAVCFQCHAVKTVMDEGYLPGESFEAHYSTKLEVVGNSPFFPDGRVRTFAYQQSHLYSDCYLSGSMTCVDCHDPHSNDYRDIYGQRLSSRFADEQCLDCHASKADQVESHTHHATSSVGSRCVSCHMPYLQQLELGDVLRYARSDHTIPIPRPAFDDDLGIENACAGCHRELTTHELQQQVGEWYGSLKPHKDIVAGLLSIGPTASRFEAVDRLLPNGPSHPIAEVAALGVFLERYLSPDMVTLEDEVVARIIELAESDDVDVRGVALAALHLARGSTPHVRDFLVRQLDAESSSTDLIVRRRWVVTLGYLGDLYRSRGQLEAAVIAYRKALEILPDNAAVLGQLADTYGYLGEFDLAVSAFTQSLQLDPNRSLTWLNFGVALEGQDLMEDAATAYRRALDVNPRESLALFNLGNYHVRRDEYEEAIDFYERSVAADPSLARGHYFLARSLVQVNRLDEALIAVIRSLEFDPSNQNAMALRQQLAAAGR